MEKSEIMKKMEEIRMIDSNKKFTPEEMEERRKRRRGHFVFAETPKPSEKKEPPPRPTLP